MADTQIIPLGTVSTPADYTVATDQQVTIGSIFASYNGAGAAGDFIPTVELISDSAHTVIEVPHDSTITAGDSVKASWAPFLRTAPAAAAATAVSQFHGQQPSPVVIGSGSATQLDWGTQTINGTYFGTGISGGLNTPLTERAGAFVATLTVQWPAFAGQRWIRLNVLGDTEIFETKGDTDANGGVQTVTMNRFLGVPQFIIAQVFQASGVNQTLAADPAIELISYS